MNRPTWKVHLALAFVQLTFGAMHVLGKDALAAIPPLALAAMRVLAAAPLLLICAWYIDRRLPLKKDLPGLALLGLLGVCINQLAFILGLHLTSASNAAILMPSIPVFAQGFALWMGVERPTAAGIGGVACAVGGAWVMVGGAGLAGSENLLLGNGLLLLNCLSYALFLVLQKPMLKRLPPLTVVAWAYLFGGAGVAAAGFSSLARLNFRAVSSGVWLEVAYILLIPTSLNYVLNSWAIHKSTSTLAAAYIMLQPLTGTLLAAFWLGECLGWDEGIGFSLIVLGLVLVSLRGKPRSGSKEDEEAVLYSEP